MTISNEGFTDVKIQYLGEFWVMLEFTSKETMKMFQDNVSIGSWFSVIRAASLDFQLMKRIAWVEIEGIPFKLWSSKMCNRIATKWGELLDVDDKEETCYHSKRRSKGYQQGGRVGSYKNCKSPNKYVESGDNSISSGHFKKSELQRTGGSILAVLEEVIKVGTVVGYKMKGCTWNIVEIIKAKGVEEVFR
ncbi:nucleotide-binding alpha-beta plait domain-containing protein [Tanacetum coccineum]